MSSGGVFDIDGLRARLEEQESGRPDLWEDRGQAQKILREKARVECDVAAYDRIAANVEEADILLQLAVEADDLETRAEASSKLAELEWAVGDANQAVGDEAEVSEKAFDLAVLALAQAER